VGVKFFLTSYYLIFFPTAGSVKFVAMLRYPLFAALCAWLGCVVQAANITSATYSFTQDEANVTFSLTVARDTGDLYMRFAAPEGYDWVSVGIGASMKNALMFIAYPTANGTSKSTSEQMRFKLT
jgi:hypothetical protein